MLEKAGGGGGGKNKPTTQSPHLQEPKGLLGFWVFFPLRLQHKNKVKIGILACWGGQLPAPHPSGQSEPGQTEMKQRHVLRDTRAASPQPFRVGLGFMCGVPACAHHRGRQSSRSPRW